VSYITQKNTMLKHLFHNVINIYYISATQLNWTNNKAARLFGLIFKIQNQQTQSFKQLRLMAVFCIYLITSYFIKRKSIGYFRWITIRSKFLLLIIIFTSRLCSTLVLSTNVQHISNHH